MQVPDGASARPVPLRTSLARRHDQQALSASPGDSNCHALWTMRSSLPGWLDWATFSPVKPSTGVNV